VIPTVLAPAEPGCVPRQSCSAGRAMLGDDGGATAQPGRDESWVRPARPRDRRASVAAAGRRLARAWGKNQGLRW
jgi:hypothetical protein